MGTNCAAVLANLFLYYYESSFITRLEEERGREVARMFHMTFRLIDDVLSLDNLEMMQALSLSHDNGGLYPAELTLNQTSKSSTAVEFLGMNIVADQNRLRLSVFDKRKTFPFVVRRYPLMSSLIPRTIPFAVLSGQLTAQRLSYLHGGRGFLIFRGGGCDCSSSEWLCLWQA